VGVSETAAAVWFGVGVAVSRTTPRIRRCVGVTLGEGVALRIGVCVADVSGTEDHPEVLVGGIVPPGTVVLVGAPAGSVGLGDRFCTAVGVRAVAVAKNGA
jgi:hypothetical protein